MKKAGISWVLVSALTVTLQAAPAGKPGVWVDPEKAAVEHPDFLLQGEYAGDLDGKKAGLQVTDMDQGKFLVAEYQGGLPGAGWDKTKINSVVMDRGALKKKTEGLKRVERVSPATGRKAPDGALVVFAGEKTDLIKGVIKDGLLWPPAATTTNIGSFEMHLEFRIPFKPATPPSNQDRGNSGIYIFDNYECQVIDSFALDFVKENNPLKLQSDNKQWCGALYTFKLPDLNMAFPPLQWQTYDIDFTAPEFTNGKKTKNARISLIHNGVKVHDDIELPKGTGGGGKRPEKPRSIITFQDHGNPVAFRNIWIKAK